jgi:transketolase
MTDTALENKSLEERVARLEGIAREIRLRIVTMVYKAQSGHCGGSLSAADILAALYFDIMTIDPENPRWPDRDRFVLSKGHACPVWYASLALRGYFPESDLDRLRRMHSPLQGHPVAGKTSGVDATTGSLGVGFCEALGMALEGRMLKKYYKVYTVLGDGEINEGAVWEAAASAAKFGLDNFVAIVDRNNLQNDGVADVVMPMEPIDAKFAAFNWEVMRMDGHDMTDVLLTLERARHYRGGRPVCIVARTVKGRGVSFMENVRDWHGKPPNDQQYAQAVSDLKGGAK